MKILLMGNSYSTYWTDELCGLMNAAGYENVRVSNIYYSGCTFEKHREWHQNGEAHYDFKTVLDGEITRVKPVDMEYCLSAEADWDYISFQQSNRYSTEGMRLRNKVDLPYLYDLINTRFPNAKYFWQQNWPHEVGSRKGRGSATLEAWQKRIEAFRTIADEACAEYGFTKVPLGDAWEKISHDPVFYDPTRADEEVDVPSRSMHTRIMSNGPLKGEIINLDLSHDGDVGGGQLLNACVWFEMITHKSVIGNTFRPMYEYKGLDMTLSEKKVDMIQKAAHEAVLGVYGEEWYK